MKFTYNSRIIRHLGYELITSDEIAITELIKNSYDAKATKVNIQFLTALDKIDPKNLAQPISQEIKEIINEIPFDGLILLDDDGKGMNEETLSKGFFEVGGTLKKEDKKLITNDEDMLLGEKGIGRLAAQRISPYLIVETSIEGSNEINVVKIKWEDFIGSKDADAPEYKIHRNNSVSYTRLWLLGNEDKPIKFDTYFEERETFQQDIFGNPGKSLGKSLYVKEGLHSALSFLYSPFEKTKSLLGLEISYDSKPIKQDFNYETIKVAETIHSLDTEILNDENGLAVDLKISLKMKIQPWFVERIHHGELGKTLYDNKKRTHKEYNDLINKYEDHYVKNLQETFLLSEIFKKWNKKYKDKLPEKFTDVLLKLSPIEGKIYSFKRDKALMQMAIESAVENKIIDKKAKGITNDFKEFLDTHNGIKLYRNSFRIGTIGNKDNDWLQLQQKRTTGQQFYRFELGNVIGFIKINDKKQEYIYETSSREHLTDNVYVDVLKVTLSEIIEIFSPGFTKRAVEITKYILDLEGLIPENKTEDIETEVNQAKKVFEAAKRNIQSIKEAIIALTDNIDLDTKEKIESVQNVLKQLSPVTIDFEQNIEDTSRSLRSANVLLEVAKQQQIRIKTEAYNNYKLMANGLVTEVITHELHSLLSNSEGEVSKYEEHFKVLENYFLEQELFDINRKNLLPIKNKFTHLYTRMGDLDKFYSFLEKTFIYKGTSEDLVPVSVQDELKEITERFKFRIIRHKIIIDYNSISNIWEVPKGSLLHVFYNLIDNAIYWIKERQKLARTNILYQRKEKDAIVVRTINSTTLQVYDTGTGVIEKYQDTLFNEMESGKENGRGMGLYIVRQFLKSFGGEIELLGTKNDYGNRYIFEIRMKSINETSE